VVARGHGRGVPNVGAMTYIDRCVDSPDGYVTTVTLAPPEEAERSQGVTLSWRGARYCLRRRADMARRPALGHVVQQHRIAAENQPCQEKLQHGPCEHESHPGDQDEPNSGSVSADLSDAREFGPAVSRDRTGR